MARSLPSLELAMGILEDHHGLPEGTLGALLKWAPVLLEIERTAAAAEGLDVGETVQVAQIRGIRVRGKTLAFGPAPLERTA